MPLQNVVQMEGKALRALDPDLPMLATEVAIDLENIRLRRGESLVAATRLSEQLKCSIQYNPAGAGCLSLLDPGTITVLGEAFSSVESGRNITKEEELLGEAKRIAETLSSNDLSNDIQGLERARDFCIALAGAATTYYSAIMEPGPTHPFRRE